MFQYTTNTSTQILHYVICLGLYAPRFYCTVLEKLEGTN